jgi:hypothetical protein
MHKTTLGAVATRVDALSIPQARRTSGPSAQLASVVFCVSSGPG